MVDVSGTKIENAIQEATAQHFINSPAYANALVHKLHGEIKVLNNSREDDPLLYAYAIKDRIARIAGMIVQLSKWVDAVIASTPDELFENGAQSCP